MKKIALFCLVSVLCITSLFAQEGAKAKGKIVTLTTESYEKEIAKGLVIVDYWAPWCGPCKRLAPILDEIILEKNIKIGKLNVDDNKSLAKTNKVSTIPTMLIYKDGKLVDRLTGVYPKEELLKILSKYE